jgi:hypothetical protein
MANQNPCEGYPSQSKTFDTKAAAEALAEMVEREMH